MFGCDSPFISVARAGADTTRECRQTADRSYRVEMSDGHLDALRVFDGEDDDYDVERLQVEIALQLLKRIDGAAIDPEVFGNGPPYDVIEMVVHFFSLAGPFGLGAIA
jgi:hypothetical protein